MKTLIIVESPHKAHTISNFLSDEYIVLASKGHITDLAKGGKHGIGIDIANNFKPKYVLSTDQIGTLDSILKACKECDQILLAPDADREGEAIAWHIKQRIEDVNKPIYRITFNEITKPAVLKAIESPRDLNYPLIHAQETRRILDRIVGFMVSPFLMSFWGNNLSAGRVQSVVSRMIADRENEIETFIPQPYWTLQATFNYNGQDFIAKFEKTIEKELEANTLYSSLKGNNFDTEFEVVEVVSKDEKKQPNPPLITSTLQQVMSKLYKFSSDRTMKAAQSLYENGYTTYIRTDSTSISDEALDMARQYLSDKKHAYPKKPNVYLSKKSADAHECIRPTDVNLEPHNNYAIIDHDEKTVYEVIWKYFIASQMNPAVYSTLKITLSPKNNKKIKLKASGKTLKSKGFYDILGISDDSKIDIPLLNKGDSINLSNNNPVLLDKKQTQAPGRYSESNLIKELEKKAIGRPATYADILSKILNRNYVEKNNNIFKATELGTKITNILVKYFQFMEVNYTADLENDLDLIALGEKNSSDVLNNFYNLFKESLKKAYDDQQLPLIEENNSLFVIKNGKYGKFYSCMDIPKKLIKTISIAQ